MEQNLEGRGVSGKNDEFGNTAVERFGRYEMSVRG